MPGLKVSNYPICDETDHINANNTTKIIFGEIFFDFLCNLKEDEYKGFLKWVALIRILEVDECNRMIERKYSTHELSELCG